MRNHLCIFACAIIGATQITAMFAAESDNPLINESVLPYHYPDFDKLKDENFVPAIEAGMREAVRRRQGEAEEDQRQAGDIADGFRTECIEGAECFVGSRR